MDRTDPYPAPVLLAAALLAPPAVCGLLAPVRSVLAPSSAALVLVLVVLAVAAAGSRVAGVLAALSGAAGFDLFLTVPYGSLRIADAEDVETAVLLALIGLAVTELVLVARRAQARSSRQHGYLAGVLEAADLVARGEGGSDVVVDHVRHQVRDLLGVDRCTFSPGRPGSHPRLERDGTVTSSGRRLDVERTGLPVDDVVELPVTHAGDTLGRFVLTATSRVVWPHRDQLVVAVALADQAGLALADPRRAAGEVSR